MHSVVQQQQPSVLAIHGFDCQLPWQPAGLHLWWRSRYFMAAASHASQVRLLPTWTVVTSAMAHMWSDMRACMTQQLFVPGFEYVNFDAPGNTRFHIWWQSDEHQCRSKATHLTAFDVKQIGRKELRQWLTESCKNLWWGGLGFFSHVPGCVTNTFTVC